MEAILDHLNAEQEEMLLALAEEWNRSATGKTSLDLMGGNKVTLLMVTLLLKQLRRAALEVEDPEVYLTWALVTLGVFLKEQGLMNIEKKVVQ